MKKKVNLKTILPKNICIFKLMNRKGYAAICKGNLTEGSTPYQAYERMNKALKRMGCILKPLTALQVKKLVKKNK